MTKRAWLAAAGALAALGAAWTLLARADRTLPPYAAWRPARPAPIPFRESAVVVAGDRVVVFGGFHTADIKATDAVQVYDPASDRWSLRRPMPTPVTHAMAAQDGDTVWFAGGFLGDNPGPTVVDVWRYDLARDAWQPGPPLPMSVSGGGLVRLGRRLHYFGGYLSDRNTSGPDHWTLELDHLDGWREASPLRWSRGHLAAVGLNGDLYAIGGAVLHDPLSYDVAVVQRFDPPTAAWSEVAPLPDPLSHAEPGTFVDRGRIVVVGGRDNHRAQTDRDEVTDRLLTYDPASDLWLELGRLPRPLAGAVARVIGGGLIVAGGGGGDGLVPTAETWTLPFRDAWLPRPGLPEPLGNVTGGIIGRYLYVVGTGSAATLAYDLGRARWQRTDRLAFRPVRGAEQVAEASGGRLYVFGARGSEPSTQVYDPDADNWRLGAPMPFIAMASASAVIDGRVYVAGGAVRDSTTARAAVYDPATDSWRDIAPMPRPRDHAAGGTDGRRFYVFGGRALGVPGDAAARRGSSDVQVYDPAADRWVSTDGNGVPLAPMPSARYGMSKAAFLDGEFYLFGGRGARDGPRRGAVSGAVDIYDPRGNRWRSGRPMVIPREGALPVAAAGWILVAGGADPAARGRSAVLDLYAPPISGPDSSAAAVSVGARQTP